MIEFLLYYLVSILTIVVWMLQLERTENGSLEKMGNSDWGIVILFSILTPFGLIFCIGYTFKLLYPHLIKERTWFWDIPLKNKGEQND